MTTEQYLSRRIELGKQAVMLLEEELAAKKQKIRDMEEELALLHGGER